MSKLKRYMCLWTGHRSANIEGQTEPQPCSIRFGWLRTVEFSFGRIDSSERGRGSHYSSRQRPRLPPETSHRATKWDAAGPPKVNYGTKTIVGQRTRSTKLSHSYTRNTRMVLNIRRVNDRCANMVLSAMFVCALLTDGERLISECYNYLQLQ